MTLIQAFEDIPLSNLHTIALKCHEGGWRGVQMLCVNTDDGVDLTYTFEKDGEYQNLQVRGVKPTDKVASLQDLYLTLFPFENEAHELFGVNIEGMVLDFKGSFYDLAHPEPMTIVSPEMKAAKEKAAKAAAAKAAKAAKDAAAEQPAPTNSDILTDKQIGERMKRDDALAETASEGGAQ